MHWDSFISGIFCGGFLSFILFAVALAIRDAEIPFVGSAAGGAATDGPAPSGKGTIQ